MAADSMSRDGIPQRIQNALSNYWSATWDCGVASVGADDLNIDVAERGKVAYQALIEAIKADRAYLSGAHRG